jgi:hypothetical protein
MDIEDARGYLDNSGFGGHTLFSGTMPDDARILYFDAEGRPSDASVWERAYWMFVLDHFKVRRDVPMPGTEEYDAFIRSRGDEYDPDIMKVERIVEDMERGYLDIQIRGFPYAVWEDSPRASEVLRESGYDAVQYYDDFPSGCRTMFVLTDNARIENVEEIGHSEASWQVERRLASRGVGRGWYGEPVRHSLAARGLRTAGIRHSPVPVSTIEVYYTTMEKPRTFAGSGLSDIEAESVVKEAHAFMDVFNIENYDPEYHEEVLNDFIFSASLEFEPEENGYKKVQALLELMNYKPRIRSVYLFGSRVTGYHTEDSDLDVRIVLEQDPELDVILTRFRKATMDSRAWPNNDCTMTFISKLWLESMRRFYEMRHWQPTGVKRPPGMIYDERGNEIMLDVTVTMSEPTELLHSLKIWEAP